MKQCPACKENTIVVSGADSICASCYYEPIDKLKEIATP